MSGLLEAIPGSWVRGIGKRQRLQRAISSGTKRQNDAAASHAFSDEPSRFRFRGLLVAEWATQVFGEPKRISFSDLVIMEIHFSVSGDRREQRIRLLRNFLRLWPEVWRPAPVLVHRLQNSLASCAAGH